MLTKISEKFFKKGNANIIPNTTKINTFKLNRIFLNNKNNIQIIPVIWNKGAIKIHSIPFIYFSLTK